MALTKVGKEGIIGISNSSDATAITIDSSENVLVGKTANNDTAVGGSIRAGESSFVADGSKTVLFNRLSSGGDIVEFRKDSTVVGSIAEKDGEITVGSGDVGLRFFASGDAVIPVTATNQEVRDNAIDLGGGSFRFEDIFATNGTIQTSDANEKQDIEELTDAEQRVAVAAKGLLRKYRWKDSVAEKGDDARIHFGIIAQDLKAAFKDEGLDAGRYAMFINSEWTDEKTGEQRNRMGIRYNQLLAFIIAAI
mgnify:CR=1 FL=1